ncbi:MAG TPA: glycosyltransferase family 4 protein [Flavipsychrobacter sp.]|nr:glycosyltransferase family 4 protein [Flavipsychrobacter sp.]
MKILIIDNSVAYTGAFKCALNEADILSDQHNFIFILPQESKVVSILQEKGYCVYTLPLKEISKSLFAIAKYPFYYLKNLLAVKKIVRQEKVEVVQINDFYNLLGAGIKAAGYKGKLITYVRFLPSTLPTPLRKICTNAAQHFSDKVVAVSDAVLKQLPPHDKNIRIYDPVKLSEKIYTEELHTNHIQLLYLANFTRGKGQEHAVEAFCKAYKKNKDLRLKFTGGDMGLAKNAAFRSELINRVKKLGLEDVVAFENFATDVESEINSASIVLNFSEAESFSMTCLEASFYGTPVIATKCGGPEEIIAHNETGLLVVKKDVDAMTEAILDLANNPEKRLRFSMRGKQYVREKFSIEVFKKSFTEILR